MGDRHNSEGRQRLRDDPPPSRHYTGIERRRLRILSALFEALEKRGHKVATNAQDPRDIALIVDGERIEFSLSQHRKQVEEDLTPEELMNPLNVSLGIKSRTKLWPTVVYRHIAHPESKSAGPDGQPCGTDTTGELQRLHVTVVDAMHIGKESHELEEVQAQLVTPSTTYVTYRDKVAEWDRDLLTLLQIPRRLLANLTGLHPRSLRAILNRARNPHPRHRAALQRIAQQWRLGRFSSV